LLQLAAGDEAGYSATCADLLARHGDHPSAATATGIALACIAGDRAVEDMNKVVQIVQRLADSDPLNPAFQSWLGAAQFRAGQTEEAIERLRKSVPLHSVAALAAPGQIDRIRVSWLTSETIRLAYHRRTTSSWPTARRGTQAGQARAQILITARISASGDFHWPFYWRSGT
jgi:hypothetical protein